MTLLDATLRAASLRPGDLDDLRFFGVGGALVVPDDVAASAAEVERGWDALAGPALRRLRRAGLEAWAALGVHPLAIPRRGLEALLAALPEHLGRRGVAAVGPIGLERGGRREEEVLERQLALALELRRPVLVHAPRRDRERTTRRVLAALRAAEVEPGRALVAADSRTVKMIRACGYLAALELSDPAGGSGPLDEAVRVVRALGPEGIALASGAGGGGDLLAVPRAAARMAKAGLSPAVVRRVCGGNLARWVGR